MNAVGELMVDDGAHGQNFVIHEMYEKQKDWDRYGCSFGKLTRERVDEVCKRQNSHEKFMEVMSVRMIALTVATVLLALMTGAEVASRFAQWVGLIR